ncbi:hypothetical protein GCM10023189_01830 [Nibrella saemangeumensis]|uniref:Cytochrome c domain-containing protein n=1 Tax=Nibrella saemangeumensis TaxID=1084526 RepID=A0ABP8MBD4_9BACT
MKTNEVRFISISRQVFLITIIIGLYTAISGTQALGQAQNAYATDKQVIAKGQQLFQQNCSACHNFLQKGIGPNLAQVTAEVSPQWLKKFIHNAPAVIASGDARATKLYKEYQQYMPAFTSLSDTDLQALMSFIHSRQKSAASPETDKMLGDALKDPIPTKIQKSGLQLSLEKVTTAPATANQVPLARITQMRVLPGVKGQKDRQFIVDHRGQLYEMVADKLEIFMDMNKERAGFINKPGLATGFGSFAFHPEFYQNGLLYTTHTEKANAAPADFAYPDSIKITLQWVVTEWKMTDPTSSDFKGTGRELFRVNMVSPIHGMQEITFNPLAKPGSPDYGLLYIGIGDGGASENGFYFICNDNTKIWSSVLRIDPRGTNSRNGRYGIPANNPYAKSTNPAVKKEVFCRGFRNPNRICWTPDGKMLITDIGHANAEELNIGVAGADYGWPEREGTFVINHRGKMAQVYALPQEKRQYTYPVAEYDHDEGNAISGGFVYTGTAIPELTGKYIFGDIVNGRVFYVDSRQLKLGDQAPVQELDIQLNGAVTDFRTLSGSKKTDLRFGQGLNQELYLFTKADGVIYKVVDSSLTK